MLDTTAATYPTREQQCRWIAKLRARETEMKAEAATQHGLATSAAGAAYVWRGLGNWLNNSADGMEGEEFQEAFAQAWQRQWRAVVRAPVKTLADLEAKLQALYDEIMDQQGGRQDIHTRALARIVADARSLATRA